MFPGCQLLDPARARATILLIVVSKLRYYTTHCPTCEQYRTMSSASSEQRGGQSQERPETKDQRPKEKGKLTIKTSQSSIKMAMAQQKSRKMSESCTAC